MSDNIDEPIVATVEDLQQQLEVAQKEAEANLNGWKRSEADFQNYQKRKENENKELIDFAREVAVAKLLPSLDSLEQALRHAPEFVADTAGVGAELARPQLETGGQGQPLQTRTEDAPQNFNQQYQVWLTGINGLVKQLDKALEELGVKKIEAVGKKFDPNFHEAVREVPGEEDGMVVEEYQTGFELNGKLIRPAQVAISKKE